MEKTPEKPRTRLFKGDLTRIVEIENPKELQEAIDEAVQYPEDQLPPVYD